MRTYAIRDARTKTTGHLRQDGTRTTYCNRPVGIPNGDFTGLKSWKMCQPCVTAEARDRAHAEEVAAQHAEPTPAVHSIVVIPCGATKLDHPAPAAELYTGSYHRACARAAAALTASGGTVLILSALHGLIPLDRVLSPYEMRMGAPGSITPDTLRKQARALGLDRATDVTILAGLTYATAALAVWPHAATPLAGLPGMGHHMRALAMIASGDQQPTAVPNEALYAPRGLRNLTTGHLFNESTGRAYCGAELAGPNGIAVLVCAACRRHRAAAASVADALNRPAPTPADRAAAARESRQTAELITEAEATAGTWRGQWIGDTTALFDRPVEQGALFA
ncbi:DUF6884 domain-containing protein [[Kitasatospora] papulosa]|uniref:DUF6884 domain-containing protein n=1 Tax=[Kitasatospora] papulosa TaxID=1464011 RepID=UPI00369A6E6A